ncbi:MAG: DUF58 domain-containing protein [Actinobacteria bacterium]|nr:DUF58 domain-containing protein [Actinomycetota bacterium]
MSRLLSTDLVAGLSRFRLQARRRVAGRYAGGHASRRFGSSLDFADYREYVAGDDPRRLDLPAYLRLGRMLVKLYEAEDEAALRIVLDRSASMTFGDKLSAAQQVAAAFGVLATNGQDRVRLIAADGDAVAAGPWLRGPSAPYALEDQLLAAVSAVGGDEPAGRPDLVAALRRAHGEGPTGPVVLISDLLFDGWDEVVRTLAAGRGDALLVQVLGRDDLDPPERGDLRLVDAETGEEVEVGIAEDTLRQHAEVRDAWLDAIAEACGRHGVVLSRLVDDEPVDRLVFEALRRLGVVA